MERLLMRAPEIAEALGMSRTRVYQLLASGELPTVRVGRSVRVPAEALRSWVRERGNGQAEPEHTIQGGENNG